MLYINDTEQPYKTYDEVVAAAIANGVDPKRAYIYLAAFGVKGALARIITADGVDYLPPVKLAIKDKKVVRSVSVCKSCKMLVIK